MPSLGTLDEHTSKTSHTRTIRSELRVYVFTAPSSKTACRSIGDVIQALLKPSANSGGKSPIIIFVHQVPLRLEYVRDSCFYLACMHAAQIHDWAARANAVKNADLKHLGDAHCWKVATTADGVTPGMRYKDFHSTSVCRVFLCCARFSCSVLRMAVRAEGCVVRSGAKVWLGANGIEDGPAVELFKQGTFPLDSLPETAPRFADPFSSAARAATSKVRTVLFPCACCVCVCVCCVCVSRECVSVSANDSPTLLCDQVVKWYRTNNETEAATILQTVLDTGGSDDALGLQFDRKFEDGKIGFPGTFRASNGQLVPVRVLSGLPNKLWTPRMDAPVAPMLVPQPVATRVRDRPQAPRPFRCKLAGCYKTFVQPGTCNRHMTQAHPESNLVPHITAQQASRQQRALQQPRRRRARQISSSEEDSEQEGSGKGSSSEDEQNADDEQDEEEDEEDSEEGSGKGSASEDKQAADESGEQDEEEDEEDSEEGSGKGSALGAEESDEQSAEEEAPSEASLGQEQEEGQEGEESDTLFVDMDYSDNDEQ